ncbi:MAG: Arc family DNA binding domain-containing protein [Proteobacteria bacterium]|nr:Arc family DNA binding domain-containing protein [Pseudomonadota bacterium]
MSEKKSYPLRIGADVLQAMQQWADDELRSVNAQIEYVLREALRKGGRLKKSASDADARDAAPPTKPAP